MKPRDLGDDVGSFAKKRTRPSIWTASTPRPVTDPSCRQSRRAPSSASRTPGGRPQGAIEKCGGPSRQQYRWQGSTRFDRPPPRLWRRLTQRIRQISVAPKLGSRSYEHERSLRCGSLLGQHQLAHLRRIDRHNRVIGCAQVSAAMQKKKTQGAMSARCLILALCDLTPLYPAQN